MKNEMNAENMYLVNEEKLEEVSGGFSNRRPYIDGYADTPDVVPPVKNINSDGINTDAVMKRRNRFDPKKPRSEESAQGHQ